MRRRARLIRRVTATRGVARRASLGEGCFDLGASVNFSKLLLAAAKGACPGVSLEAPERAMLMDDRRARPLPVFLLDAASILQAASSRQLH